MPRVLIGPALLATDDGPWRRELTAAGFELVFPGIHEQLTEEEVFAKLSGIDAALVGSEPYSRRSIDAHSKLRIISRVGVGYDAVDVEAATEHGIVVTTTPGTNHDAVAEHTFGLILALAKTILQQHE